MLHYNMSADYREAVVVRLMVAVVVDHMQSALEAGMDMDVLVKTGATRMVAPVPLVQ